MTCAHLNRIATSVPPFDIHEDFIAYASRQLVTDARSARIFRRLAEVGEIEHRYSFMKASEDPTSGKVDRDGIYARGAFPGTAQRMKLYEKHALPLAIEAVERLNLGVDRGQITHLIVSSCTGFSAPGLDFQLISACGLPSHIERTMVGFMGCYAAINCLKLARHIVRSEPNSKVLILNLELCSAHLKETCEMEQLLCFFLFGDGCAASIVSADEQGFTLDRFLAVLAPGTESLITWKVGDSGFDMILSGQVPAAIRDALRAQLCPILDGGDPSEIDLWAVHPGGKSVLDAVQLALRLPTHALNASRDVLRRYGNMSSATVMFVLKELMKTAVKGQTGSGMAFGPGLVAETMLFHAV